MGTTGLMIAGQIILGIEDNGWLISECCPKLAQLLIEYGANVDIRGECTRTALQMCSMLTSNLLKDTQYICLLIESGANSENLNLRDFVQSLCRPENTSVRLIFVHCIKKLLVLDENLVSRKLKKYYRELLQKSNNFNELSFENDCLKELDGLSKLGLRHQLAADATVWHDYRAKFGSLIRSSDSLANFPIYGRLLKIRVKRRLVAFGKKKKLAWEAMPYITSLVQKFCILPSTCAQEILWNFNCNELDAFIEISS